MEKLIPVCVYCDSTDLYTEDEIMRENLTYLLFPERIVQTWYEAHKKEFDETTMFDLGVPESECSFETWYEKVYTAVDTDGLFEFAEDMGFKAKRPAEDAGMLKDIVWHDMSDTPPVNTPLLIIDESEAFGEGYYFEFEGSALRAIRFWFNEPEGKKAGDTVLWAELPSREEIEAFIYNRKESV